MSIIQKDITVDFPIDWNRKNGKIKVSTFKRVVKHLIANNLLKKDHEYFIKDSDGVTTYWVVTGKNVFNSWYNWSVSCEFTEDETGNEIDWYNALYFDKAKGGIGECQYESYKVR